MKKVLVLTELSAKLGRSLTANDVVRLRGIKSRKSAKKAARALTR